MMDNVIHKIKTESNSFFKAVAESNEMIYMLLLSLYVALFIFLKIAWRYRYEHITEMIQYGLLSIVMWGSTLYLFVIIANWKNLWRKTIQLIVVAAALLLATGYFSRIMSTNVYGVVFDIFFCILAFGKTYKKLLQSILIPALIMLLIAAAGLPLTLTMDIGKPNTDLPGHSLGIVYPNTWAYIFFFVMLLIWYLYLRNKPIITFIVFWSCAVFDYYYIICRTIAGIAILFPFLALLANWIEKHADKKVEEGTFKRRKLLEWIIIAIPFLAWAFMMANSFAVEWWHQFYHGPLRNLAWRFIQGGLYFKTYGLPLVGNPYRSNQYTYVNVNDEFIKVGILDSSFAAYIIMRGLIWLCYTLLWLCIAYWKALKKRDYAIILIETILLGFAMMERPGLEMWYNFILLYPLAKVISKPGTDPILEFEAASPEEKHDTSLAESKEEVVDNPEMAQSEFKENKLD